MGLFYISKVFCLITRFALLFILTFITVSAFPKIIFIFFFTIFLFILGRFILILLLRSTVLLLLLFWIRGNHLTVLTFLNIPIRPLLDFLTFRTLEFIFLWLRFRFRRGRFSSESVFPLFIFFSLLLV